MHWVGRNTSKSFRIYIFVVMGAALMVMDLCAGAANAQAIEVQVARGRNMIGYPPLDWYSDLQVQQRRLYAMGIDGRLYTYDLSDPTAPVDLSGGKGVYAMSYNFGNDYVSDFSFFVDNNRVYYVDWMVSKFDYPRGNAHIEDISNPAKPVALDGISLWDTCPIRVAANKKFVVTWNAYHAAFDFNSPYDPSEIDVWDNSNPGHLNWLRSYDWSWDGTEVSKVSFYHDLLCYSTFAGIGFLDISQSAGIKIAGCYGSGISHIAGYAFDGCWVYIADNYDDDHPTHIANNFKVLDLSDISHIKLVGQCTVDGEANGVACYGGLAFVAAGKSGVQVIDVSDPANPRWRASYPGTWMKKIGASDGVAYAVDTGAYNSDYSDQTHNDDKILIAKYVPWGTVDVSNLNRTRYRFDYFRPRNLPYVDQDVEFTTPSLGRLREQTYIRSLNEDKDSTASGFVSFDIDQSATVIVAYDERARHLPSWLANWPKTGQTLATTDATAPGRVLYSKTFPAGRVHLGGNRDEDMPKGANVMYSVFVVPNRTGVEGWRAFE